MSSYNIVVESVSVDGVSGSILRLSFGTAATNAQIVVDAGAALATSEAKGGRFALLNGPASLPVAFVLCHGLAHIYGWVGVFDPKLGGYVVAVSHDPARAVGDVVVV